jgi:alpha-1,2-mannosyltransferase
VQGRLYFTYPPFAALLLWPFGLLPLGLTITIFTVGTVVALAVTTWWLVGRYPWPRWYAFGIALPLVFAIEPTRETITFGQLNMLLVVLILADLLFWKGTRWAGVGIGLAAAIKLVPGIFIVFLLVTRRWRAAAVAAATAAGATLLAAAVAPRDSWQFWTGSVRSTERVGRTDYTGNQSLLGVLNRLVAPADPNRAAWLVLALVIGALGLWRAARATDPIAALTLTGLVGALVSPITWPHHLYWFIPAAIVCVAAHRWWLAVLTGAVATYGVVSFEHWGVAPAPTDTVPEFLGRNAYVLLSLILLAALPIYTTTGEK